MPGWFLAFRLIGLGWYVALCILGGVVGGLFLDRWLGVLPIFTLAGVGLGSLVGFFGVYRLVAPLVDKDDRHRKF